MVLREDACISSDRDLQPVAQRATGTMGVVRGGLVPPGHGPGGRAPRRVRAVAYPADWPRSWYVERVQRRPAPDPGRRACMATMTLQWLVAGMRSSFGRGLAAGRAGSPTPTARPRYPDSLAAFVVASMAGGLAVEPGLLSPPGLVQADRGGHAGAGRGAAAAACAGPTSRSGSRRPVASARAIASAGFGLWRGARRPCWSRSRWRRSSSSRPGRRGAAGRLLPAAAT